MIRHFIKLKNINYSGKQLLFLFAALIILPATTKSQNTLLRNSISRIVSTIDGKVGVAVMHIENRDTLFINEKSHFPMQSVFKFSLAMAVLK